MLMRFFCAGALAASLAMAAIADRRGVSGNAGATTSARPPVVFAADIQETVPRRPTE
jgi:hypothetical protein